MNLIDKTLRACPVAALLVATAVVPSRAQTPAKDIVDTALAVSAFKTLAAPLHRASLDTDFPEIEAMTCSR